MSFRCAAGFKATATSWQKSEWACIGKQKNILMAKTDGENPFNRDISFSTAISDTGFHSQGYIILDIQCENITI